MCRVLCAFEQFGTTANDFGYGASLDGSFQTILLSGSCITDQIDEVIEVPACDVFEPRQEFAMYEPQLMDPLTRKSSRKREYEFAVSLNFRGDILDYAMDGGVTLTPRRRRINEDGLVAEYVVVLNRQPLQDVTIHAKDVRLVDGNSERLQQLRFLTPQDVTFTRQNWNREQVIRVAAVDDTIAEDTHYAVISHYSTSLDPNFNGPETPFLYGSNLTFQIIDNDVAGINISRRHMLVGEGGAVDSYEIVLKSQPWHPVEVTMIPLHSNQTIVSPTRIVILPHEWNVPRNVVVSAVDDSLSEVEFGGLHYGGQILHYATSRDPRYNTRRPQCFDLKNCNPDDPTVCLFTDPALTAESLVRVCDINATCDLLSGNGACVSSVSEAVGNVPARFGNRPLDPSIDSGGTNDSDMALTYSDLLSTLSEQQLDQSLFQSVNVSGMYEFVDPRPEMRGFVLSFLGLLNLRQVRQVRTDPAKTLQAVCSGILRLEVMRWAFEEWPTGYTSRVLAEIFKMFPYITQRHIWNCGLASIDPGSSINVSIWDNDPGVTLSDHSIDVRESSVTTNCTGSNGCATYSIVLNAPPWVGNTQPTLREKSICSHAHSDDCGLWTNVSVFAASAYAVPTSPQVFVSIAIVGNSQLNITPSIVTFSSLDWFIPRTVTIRAVDDNVAEQDSQYLISHRVENSTYGFTDSTAFWFKGTLSSSTRSFSGWNSSKSIPYNAVPTVVHSPDHRQINVNVRDNDTPGISVLIKQPNDTLLTKEALDTMDSVGDYVTAMAFSDISLPSEGIGTDANFALDGILVFAPNSTTLMKFHVPQLHVGDTNLVFAGAMLQLHQTPYKIFNVSEEGANSAAASVEDSQSFTKIYRTKLTVVDNGWTADGIASGGSDISAPTALKLMQNASINALASVEKSRSVEIDISPLIRGILPTRLPIISIQIDILADDTNGSQTVTQLCSSRFERALRPKLVYEYQFQNLLLNATASQSSTAVSTQTTLPMEASSAIDGDRYDSEGAITRVELSPWWQVNLPTLTKIGTIAVFVPDPNASDDGTTYIDIIATSLTLGDGLMELDDALSYGCPENCPQSRRLTVRRGVLLWDVQAGVRSIRIFGEGRTSLHLKEVEAFAPTVSVELTSDGKGIRSRLKTDWTSNRVSDSWQLLHTVRDSEDENLAARMPTRQSSTSPAHALSYLAADGERHRSWDSTVLKDGNLSATLTSTVVDASDMEAGSSRTSEQENPWWEVDLGSSVPISSIVIFPYVGEAGHDVCGSEIGGSQNNRTFEQIGDLYNYSRTDRLLLLETPFVQQFEIVVSDVPLSNGSDVVATATKTLLFSCTGRTNSIKWSNAFVKGRFVTVRKHGLGVLMLNEVEVYRWNPATTPQYVLLDMFGTGERTMGVASAQLYPPAGSASVSDGATRYALPISYTIHSYSSQRASTGAGSASALLSLDASECYVGADSSAHEWIVLALSSPTPVGFVEINSDVTRCGNNMESPTEISIGCHGASITNASAPSTAAHICDLNAAGRIVSTSTNCDIYRCSESDCHSSSEAKGTTTTLQLSDFVDVVSLGKVRLTPLSRLPLSENEHRTVIMRDNPAILWPFDEEPAEFVSDKVPITGVKRVAAAFSLATTASSKTLLIDDVKEQTYFSSSVVRQPAMSAFTVEFWVQLSGSPQTSFRLTTLATSDGEPVDIGIVGVDNNNLYFELNDPSSADTCRTEAPLTPTMLKWHHVSACYNPSSATVSVSSRFWSDPSEMHLNMTAKSTRCSLTLIAKTQKYLQFGARAATSVYGGFVGKLADVAWYTSAVGSAALLDHFHDFFDGTSKRSSTAHNVYSLQLAARPDKPVTIEIVAETTCFLFNLCNTSVSPNSVTIFPENWQTPTNIRVLATNDNLFEGFHYSDLFHTATSSPVYQLMSYVDTPSLFDAAVAYDGSVEDTYQHTAAVFYDSLVLKRQYDDDGQQSLVGQSQLLSAYHQSWTTQTIKRQVVESDQYSMIVLPTVSVAIVDLTVPGIEFSTSSLTVSEDGRGNDYQVVLLSEPKDSVIVVLSSENDCYRTCFHNPVCPSQSASAVASACGSGQSNLLCNVSISPEVLYFSRLNWSTAQTVRVVAVDDFLDEADLHVTTITASSISLDPVYNQLDLPDIAVFVEDNDDTEYIYSTKHIYITESYEALINAQNVTGLNYTKSAQYQLSLGTEPWANVTVAMSNEANRSCYRSCGYHFDDVRCGLPRQQSVSLVKLLTNSSREIHQIALSIPKVTEVQRIVTYSDHVDQVYRLRLIGGYRQEIQAVMFAFSSEFKAVYRSNQDIAVAVQYGRTFRVGLTGQSPVTGAIDGFAAADKIQEELDKLFGGTNFVRVSRTVDYDQGYIRWTVAFSRLLSVNGIFPLLTATAASNFQGAVTVSRVQASAAPTGTISLRYGGNATSMVAFDSTSAELESLLKTFTDVYVATVSRGPFSGDYGLEFNISFVSVGSYRDLQADASRLTPADGAAANLSVTIQQTRSPAYIGGTFLVTFVSSYSSLNPVNKTSPIAWNASSSSVADEISKLTGVGRVSVARMQLTPEGGMEWTIQFDGNNGDVPSLRVQSVNLSGPGVQVATSTIRDGQSLLGSFVVEMGGLFKRVDNTTGRAYSVYVPPKNTTRLAYNATAGKIKKAFFDLNVTGKAHVSRKDSDCDAFAVCNGYTWTISYINSPGDLPPIKVYGNVTGQDAVISATTVANGTYLGGKFSLTLELVDIDTNIRYVGKTWNLPVNVSAVGMDEALEALYFVRSDREAEFDPETRGWRGIKFDKGVRVYRDGPFLDGGYMWRLEWALQDYIRFEDLKITIDTALVTQEVHPLEVASEFALDGSPRCGSIPNARFQRDTNDSLGLRGFCVYDIINATIQERFVCNYTVLNPWIVFTPDNWCVPQPVRLQAVDDHIDEQTVQNGNVTFSNVTHTIFSDDLIYVNLYAPPVEVAVASDDVAKVLVSESLLEVSEGGAATEYFLQLNSEPLYDVKVVVLPWLDDNNTLCYRFELCNVTIPTSEYLFTPGNWDIPQRVVVQATDDNLDEYDVHMTGISHVSYSDDIKYHKISIPKINVRVTDNDVSRFSVLKTRVNVTEGGNSDEYAVVLGSEPFSKVIINIKNLGTTGNYAIATPSQLVFTWTNWNVTQTVRIDAFDDFTQDAAGSSSLMVHSIVSNDVIYANLKNLSTVTVAINDNDRSGIELSTNAINATESNSTIYTYRVRLRSEPWHPVVVTPNSTNDCYTRALSRQQICNVTMLTPSVYFDAGNWSTWANLSFLAVDDWLTEAKVHRALITHSTSSNDPLYQIANYSGPGGYAVVSITDNDISFVNIVLQVPGGALRSSLHVSEGGFNDSYRISLSSEPYNDVTLTLVSSIETIVNIDNNTVTSGPQIVASYNTGSSIATTAGRAQSIQLVFSSQDWFRERVIRVAAIDDMIPEVPTQYTKIIHMIESADANYNISNATIGVVNVNISVSDREVISPPLPINATIDGTGSKIDVLFDSTVYHAATMNYSVRSTTGTAGQSVSYVIRLKNFACTLVFDVSSASYVLGSGATCVWVDFKHLRMQLGAGMTLGVDDILVLNPCETFANEYCQSDVVLRARYTSRSYSQGFISVRAPVNAITPSIVLMAPDEAGSCGTWSVDASLSTGGGGRAFAISTWFAIPSSLLSSQAAGNASITMASSLQIYSVMRSVCTKYALDWQTGKSNLILVPQSDISASNLTFLSTMAQLRTMCYLRSLARNATGSASLSLTVNSALVEAGVRYHVGLELVNAFAERSVSVKTILTRQDQLPAVLIVGDSVVNITRGSDTLVIQAGSSSTCSSVNITAVSYRWFATSTTIAGASPARTEDFNGSNTARDSRAFRVPKRAFEAGRQYTFRVEAYTLTNGARSGTSASIVVNVGTSSPVITLTGGSRTIGVKDYVSLVGAAVDSDNSTVPFQYVWKCTDMTDATAPAECQNASANSTLELSNAHSTNLTLAPYSLRPNRTLRFSLAGLKGVRTGVGSTTIWTMDTTGPAVVLASPSVKINPSTTVKLTAVISSEYPYTCRWVQVQGDLNMSTQSDTNLAFSLPLTSPNNAVVKNALTAGVTYTFRLVATDINGNTGFGAITIDVNAPPSSGTFSVSPRVGYAINDLFTLTCARWTDEVADMPLKYAFAMMSTTSFENIRSQADNMAGFALQVAKLSTPLVPEQLSPSASVTVFPSAQLADSENVTVVAFITDVLGAVAIAYESIEVVLPTEAKSQPIVFVSNMFNSTAMHNADSPTKIQQALSAAKVLKSAFTGVSETGCQAGGEDASCSSRGICDPSTGQCVCSDGYIGSSCQYDTESVQEINSVVLTALASSSLEIEPTNEGLSQQALVAATILEAAPSSFTSTALVQITSLTKDIAGNALTVQDPSNFYESTSSTIASVASTSLGVISSAQKTKSKTSASRRLSTSDSACASTVESSATFTNIIQSLQSVSALAGRDQLVNEPAALLSSPQVDVYSSAGNTLRTTGSNGLAVNLTDLALECMDSDLFMTAFAIKSVHHPNCSLNESTPLSRSTVVTVYSQAAYDAATTGAAAPSVEIQTLDSTSACIRKAAAQAGSTGRRLDARTGEAAASSLWLPLLIAAIPHERELSSVEQRNFSTACRVWNSDLDEWGSDVCYKDAATSTSETTVCYCNAIGRLEVLVTLEETLDFYALTRDLYRDDPMSIVPAITIIVLIVVCASIERVGHNLDVSDAKKAKDAMVQKLSRSKWTELETRTHAAYVFEDFETYYHQKKIDNEKELALERTGATDATTGVSTLQSAEASSLSVVPIADPLTALSVIEHGVELPDEARVLFDSSTTVGRKYAQLAVAFRICNAVVLLLGLVVVFVGVDFCFVLGNTTSELLLYIYGRVLGIVLIVFGSALIATGVAGLSLARKDGSHSSRSIYIFWVWVFLIAELIFVASAYNYLDGFHELPMSAFSVLRSHWDHLSSGIRMEIQTMYGCCGFGSVSEESVCPEEALETSPPRACFSVLQSKASSMFASSFVYLQIILIVEILCVIVANVLVKWRRLRLIQLAGEPTSSTSGARSTDSIMLRSRVNVILLVSLPSIYNFVACITGAALFYGFDLLIQSNFTSSQLVAALFGVELGSLTIIASVIHLLILMKGVYAVQVRDARGLQWFIASYVAFTLSCAYVLLYFVRLKDNFYENPAISEAIEKRFSSLSRARLISLETAMQCCGFRSNSQGACNDSAEPLPACRVMIEASLVHGISVLKKRLTILLLGELTLIALTGLLWYKIRRFAPHSTIIPQESVAELSQRSASKRNKGMLWTLRERCCKCCLCVLNLSGFLFGLFVIFLGFDTLIQLNVLQMSYLLRAIDREVGIYLVCFGGFVGIYAALGLLSSLFGSRKLLQLYGWLSLALFVVCFGALGVSYRFSTLMSSNSKTAHYRLEQLWIGAPSTVKIFAQNSFDCCGFEKTRASNGSDTFTHPAEIEYWDQSTVSTTAYSFSSDPSTAAPAGSSSAALPSSWTKRLLSETSVNVTSRTVCPKTATEGCSLQVSAYLKKATRSATASLFYVGAYAVAATFCAAVVLYSDVMSDDSGFTVSWKLGITRTTLLLCALGCVFSSLACLFIGVDIAARLTLFSSPLLQLVFSLSIGVAFIVFGTIDLSMNIYAAQGAIMLTVHRLFVSGAVRCVLATALWLTVGLTGYLSHFSASAEWEQQLVAYLDYKWNMLQSSTQYTIALDYNCCGFNDPVVVSGKGVVFDRPPVGYSCPLSNARGCRQELVAQIGGSFGWLFQYLLGLALVESLMLILALFAVRHLRHVKKEEWFRIASRIHYAVGKFKSEARKKHLLVSVYATFDAKFTRTQRVLCILCALMTTLAIYTSYFATQGCARTALKTCEQPSVWAILGMGLLYGGCAGFAAQGVARLLFELVRNRSDDETKEVATARQRKEKVLLFRGLFKRRSQISSNNAGGSNADPQAGDSTSRTSSRSYNTSETSSITASQTTTEERWYNWIARFLHSYFQISALLQFVVACGLATLMGLVLVGYESTPYGVKIDQGPRELLILSIAMGLTSVTAWFASDQRDRRLRTSCTAFIVVGIACVLLIAATLTGIYMLHQVLADPSDDAALENWTIRNTGFSVVRQLEAAWKVDATAYFRNTVQQDLQCCGFRDATDNAYRPCPSGGTLQVSYEAVLVNGTVVTKSQNEEQDLAGCLPAMLARFERTANDITYFAVAMCILQCGMAASSLFLARDLLTSRDAKLKLRVPEEQLRAAKGSRANRSDIQHTFEKVVGLKIATPARGKILSKMLASSLDSVTPRVANELAAVPLATQDDADEAFETSSSARAASAPTNLTSPRSSQQGLNRGKSLLTPTFARKRGGTNIDFDNAARVPYPSWIVYVVFWIVGVWTVAMGYLVVVSSMLLGTATAWFCVLSWIIGIIFHFAIVEPAVLFAFIIAATLHDWWGTTWLGRLLHRGREALRIRPDAATRTARYYASLSLYERIRYNAAVRIQRRLLTMLTRQRFLQQLRDLKQLQQRQLAERRRVVLRETIENFTEEEIAAFSIIFRDADTAQLGLVPYSVISHSIYQLGVHVPSAIVHQFLTEFDPAYADLVDFEHFLYGMHCARVHHQQEQKEKTIAAEKPAAVLKEEVVSSSLRYGPTADPRAKIIVKRQNLLRELKEKRDTLAYKLMGKVSKLPPIQQQQRSSRHLATDVRTQEERQTESDSRGESKPAATYVLMQNRKLSPTKRALEVILKKKHREKRNQPAVGSQPVAASPPSPARKAKTLMQQWKGVSPPPQSLASRADGNKEEAQLPANESELEIKAESKTEMSMPPPTETPDSVAQVVAPLDSEEQSNALQTAELEQSTTSAGKYDPSGDSDAKPIGTFMLLTGQDPSSGKSRILENVFKKQQIGGANAENQPGDSQVGAPAQHSEVSLAGSPSDSARPRTAEKKPASAKNNLEKALKKQRGKKPAPTGKSAPS